MGDVDAEAVAAGCGRGMAAGNGAAVMKKEKPE
jgi:hypothetical protein